MKNVIMMSIILMMAACGGPKGKNSRSIRFYTGTNCKTDHRCPCGEAWERPDNSYSKRGLPRLPPFGVKKMVPLKNSRHFAWSNTLAVKLKEKSFSMPFRETLKPCGATTTKSVWN
jgi:hypothetical protein